MKFYNSFLWSCMLSTLISGISVCGQISRDPVKFEIIEWETENTSKLLKTLLLNSEENRFEINGLTVNIVNKKIHLFDEWKIEIKNNSHQTRRLILQISMADQRTGGVYWNGAQLLQENGNPHKYVQNRHVFPAAVYLKNELGNIVGLSPETFCSRFESSCRRENGIVINSFASYLALMPEESDQQTFISARLKNTVNYGEVVENIYLAYPEKFKPVDGVNPKLYGEGGYFYSSSDSRMHQLEEARRLKFDWEWLYAVFQKPGDIWPSEKHWDNNIGYSVEKTQNVATVHGSIDDWKKYLDARIAAGNKTSALFYYYLQQYSEVGVLNKSFPDSKWVFPDGKTPAPVYGWIKDGMNVQYSWPGNSSYGNKLRGDLREVWNYFPISGFAMDMTIGDSRYSGGAIVHEKSKSFDEKGRLFVAEGVALAHNIDYTHTFPPNKTGFKAASITNEVFTYLPAFHGDAILHEMPPYDRADIVPIRRLLGGQKPLYWWKGFREDQILDMDRLNVDQIQLGLSGIVDYVLLSSLRFGAIPAVFFAKGYPDVNNMMPILVKLQKAGWRAGIFADMTDEKYKLLQDPFSSQNRVWISRYGDNTESFLVFSAPDKAAIDSWGEIHTDKFNSGGSVYINILNGETRNQIEPGKTSVKIFIQNHTPVILQKIAEIRGYEKCDVLVKKTELPTQHIRTSLISSSGWTSDIEIKFSGQNKWIKPYSGSKEICFDAEPDHYVLPDKSWLSQLKFGNFTKPEAVIVVDKEDEAALEPAISHLKTYWEYYASRQKNPHYRLWDMDDKWLTNLRLPVVASIDAPAARQAGTLFIIGAKIRKSILNIPERGNVPVWFQQKTGNQNIIVFNCSDANQEKIQIMKFLEEMDKFYPYYGVITDIQKDGIYKKSFKKAE